MTILGLLGYTKKTSFKAGISMTQISEFSLIFILLGADNQQISESTVSLMTLVALITIAISSYMIIYSDGIYTTLQTYLTLFERRKVRSEHAQTSLRNHRVWL